MAPRRNEDEDDKIRDSSRRLLLFFSLFILATGDEFAEEFGVLRDEGDRGLAVYNVLRFKSLKEGIGDGRVLGNLLEGRADDLRADG